jgi:hypothetical protein
MVRQRAQARQVVPVEVGFQTKGGGEVGQRLERRSLLSGDAGNAQERGGVTEEGVRVNTQRYCPFGE